MEMSARRWLNANLSFKYTYKICCSTFKNSPMSQRNYTIPSFFSVADQSVSSGMIKMCQILCVYRTWMDVTSRRLFLK